MGGNPTLGDDLYMQFSSSLGKIQTVPFTLGDTPVLKYNTLARIWEECKLLNSDSL